MTETLTRRNFLTLATAGLGMLVLAGKAVALEAIKKLTLSDDAWKQKLTPAQFNILRREGTEMPFTSGLLHEERKGVFACVACGLALFPSRFKFDSGTGWPSFFDANPGALETKTDTSLFMERTEYHCARCGGHHGHVFNDGPQPTGLRYCNNGVALTFTPEKTA